MHQDVERILFSQAEIAEKVRELGKQMTEDLKDKNPLFIAVLKGSFIFMADLVREVEATCNVEFLGVSSYGDKSESSGAVRITRDLDVDIEGRHIVVVEDILDSGLTLSYLLGYLENRKPASISLCTLLDKPERRKVEVHPKYIGFTIPDAFVVGYGLDFAEKYRNLPYIGILKPEVYQ